MTQESRPPTAFSDQCGPASYSNIASVPSGNWTWLVSIAKSRRPDTRPKTLTRLPGTNISPETPVRCNVSAFP